MITRCALIMVWLVVVALAPVVAAQDLVATLEAEFLERFTRFIEWPASSSVNDPAVPFVIGVADHPAVVDALERIAASKKVKGKRLEVRSLTTTGQALGCNVVFVGPGNRERFGEFVSALSGRPILLVADSPGYGRQGAMINFLTEGEFVRFEVNKRAAEANGLRLAAELLALGEAVN
ncbi:MAG: YfiR family protein [Thermoanaerobaculales bacterium]|nr:YfiR family protein [Thermoanaerobaculales bacterium]